MKAMLIVIILHGPGSKVPVFRFPMMNMQECYKSVETVHTDIAKSGDAEQGFALFCVNKQ